jgi:hypothetical protein
VSDVNKQNGGLNKTGMVTAELLRPRDHVLDQSLENFSRTGLFLFSEARPKIFNAQE